MCLPCFYLTHIIIKSFGEYQRFNGGRNHKLKFSNFRDKLVICKNHGFFGLRKKIEIKNASAGSRTRVSCLEGNDHAVRPLMLTEQRQKLQAYLLADFSYSRAIYL